MKLSTKRIAAAAGFVIVVGGWYFFRPERAFITTSVQEAMPAGDMSVAFSGEFTAHEHEGTGLAQILILADGRRILRFTRFRTLNGPDLQVYLVGRADVANGRDLDAAGFVSLGELKGNEGDQNYEIPATVDLARYPAVSVWCRRFAVNFTAAPLSATGS